MKRLRHPVRAIREPFGTAGLIVAMIALVAALGGTALAASKLTGPQKKEVEKIAKKFQGTGPAGAPGANGTNGTNGAAGEKGTNGTNGTDGKDGANGTNGTSAEVVSFTGAKGTCTEGGLEVKSAKPTAFVCNGAEGTNGTNGTNGKEGQPWTPNNTLPPEATEKGAIAANAIAEEVPLLSGRYLPVPVPFTIPLASPLAASQIHLIGTEGGEGEVKENPAIQAGECTGTVAVPGAANGNLCLFLTLAGNVDLNEGSGHPVLEFGHTFAFEPCGFNEGACTTGTELMLHPDTASEPIFITGTWAVTAPAAP